MKKVVLGGYTGRENRGCEAIARSTSALFHKQNDVKTVLAYRTKYEFQENLTNKYFDQQIMYWDLNGRFSLLFKAGWNKVFHNTHPYERLKQKNLIAAAKGNCMVHIGGDTYCYDVPLENESLVYWCKKKKIPIFLWAASIEERAINDPRILKILKSYNKLYIREQLTYELLRKAGIQESQLFRMSDPAFSLEAEIIDLNETAWWGQGVIGINLSPISMEENPDHELVIEGCKKIINDILSNTDSNVILIPHVYKNNNDGDFIPLNKLKKEFGENNRVKILLGDYNCNQLKYVISKCRLFIAARTHASIAAYSSMVPTLVIGYSIKAKGIATDLFGDYRKYVLPVQQLKNADEVFWAFKWMESHENEIRSQLEKKIPSYRQLAELAVEDIFGN